MVEDSMPCLNKVHSLDQSSGDQKLSILRAFPIELEHVLRLLTDIKGIGRLKLHAIGHSKDWMRDSINDSSGRRRA